MAETKAEANAAFDFFIAAYDVKYDRAVKCLTKDPADLLACYDFPAEHWKHIRTTNPIESTFAVSIGRVPWTCLIDQTAFGLRGFGAHFLARRSKVSRIRPMSASSGLNFPPCHSSIRACSSWLGFAMASRKSA